MYALARSLQLLGLLLLPIAMAMQLHGMRLGHMFILAGVGAGVFYLGYLLQQKVRP